MGGGKHSKTCSEPVLHCGEQDAFLSSLDPLGWAWTWHGLDKIPEFISLFFLFSGSHFLSLKKKFFFSSAGG
jgi:hypothetical protein